VSAIEFHPCELLTEKQVAGLLKISRTTVRGMFKPVFISERGKRYIASDIMELIRSKSTPPRDLTRKTK